MRRVTTSRQMKESDRAAMEIMGMPSAVLMERAALAAADVLWEEDFDLERVAGAVRRR